MKFSDGFDARRLRPGSRKSGRLRLGLLIGTLLTLCGLLLLALGTLATLGMSDYLGPLANGLGREESIAALATGAVLLLLGTLLWRRCRRRLRQPDGLSLAPHLTKKRG